MNSTFFKVILKGIPPFSLTFTDPEEFTCYVLARDAKAAIAAAEKRFLAQHDWEGWTTELKELLSLPYETRVIIAEGSNEAD